MAIHEAWIFDDDSVLVKFQNGCLLQLSSCGAVFRSFTPSDNVTSRNICHSDQVQQYSQFATTMWKDMVRQAVDFRNKFASYPYMCHNLSEILPPAEQQKIVNSTSCTWVTENPTKCIHHGHDGSLSITSKENNASVTLSPCKQHFLVKFLCKIPMDDGNKTKRPAYSWVNQIHSANVVYPDCFYYPMSLLNSTKLRQGVDITGTDVSNLSQSLPQRCRKSHLHRWRSHWDADKIGSSEFLGRELIKVYYSEDVCYRFYYAKYLSAEVILPDGSVLRSTGPTHLFFKHCVYDVKSESVNENVLSSKTPPLNDRGRPIAKILNTVCRYLKYLSVCCERQTETLCCWKNGSDSQLIDSEKELEESNTHFRGVGSFKTYSNGRMRIVFSDGTLMDFCDPNEKGGKMRNADNEITSFGERRRAMTDNDGSFNITLPNGISLQASFDSPAEPFKRYVQIALGLIKWRQTNVEKDVEDKDRNYVYEELEKLRRFNSSCDETKENVSPFVDAHSKNNGFKIEDNGVSAASPPPFEIRNTDEYLNETRQAIDKIDLVLQNCKIQLRKK